MVRFKNRYLLVEFLSPSTLSPFPSLPPSSSNSVLLNADEEANEDKDEGEGEGENEDEDDCIFSIAPELPFLVPVPDLEMVRARSRSGGGGRGTGNGMGKDAGGDHGGGDGAQIVFRAVRGMVQDVFGDEGWGRVASSFKVIYHSPITTLTLLRVARPHYRLIWASITLLTNLNPNQSPNQYQNSSPPVVPRVIAVSGTIKKCQNRAIAYHRLVIARAIALLGAEAVASSKLDIAVEREQEMLKSIEV